MIGKVLYPVIAISGSAILTRTERMFFTANTAWTKLMVSLALAGMRHMFMLTY